MLEVACMTTLTDEECRGKWDLEESGSEREGVDGGGDSQGLCRQLKPNK